MVFMYPNLRGDDIGGFIAALVFLCILCDGDFFSMSPALLLLVVLDDDLWEARRIVLGLQGQLGCRAASNLAVDL